MPFFRQEVLKSAAFRAVFSQHFAEDSISKYGIARTGTEFAADCRNLEEAHGTGFVIRAARTEVTLLQATKNPNCLLGSFNVERTNNRRKK